MWTDHHLRYLKNVIHLSCYIPVKQKLGQLSGSVITKEFQCAGSQPCGIIEHQHQTQDMIHKLITVHSNKPWICTLRTALETGTKNVEKELNTSVDIKPFYTDKHWRHRGPF